MKPVGSLALLLAAALLAPGAADAQEAGSISDTPGLVLSGFTVEARDATEVGRVTFTDGTGQFTLGGLAPGSYELTFSFFGFNVPSQVAAPHCERAATALPRTVMDLSGPAHCSDLFGESCLASLEVRSLRSGGSQEETDA
ncbi:MAG: carboxypeptidase-like regulatory domain-containing protein [Acidobacteria bacterium]|nr:carboxypeptidase-like regulatory domain-containing protein [Acidobacteriota bacterium]